MNNQGSSSRRGQKMTILHINMNPNKCFKLMRPCWKVQGRVYIFFFLPYVDPVFTFLLLPEPASLATGRTPSEMHS